MFKLFGSLMAVFALAMPVYATHCDRERVVQDYDYSYNVENVVLVPHQKFVQREYVVENYDYYPKTVERVVQRERVINRPKVLERIVEVPVKIVERIVNRPKLRVRERVVQKEIVVQKVQPIKNRNVVRERIINEY